VLAADDGAPYRDTAKGRQHQKVHQRLTLGSNSDPRDALAELNAGQRPLVRERALDDRDRPLGVARRDAFLRQACRVAREQAMRC
jgi:hypothetical protein